MTKNKKQLQRIRRHTRIRAKVMGSSEKPRLSIWKGNRAIQLQLIDDESGKTLAGVVDTSMKGKTKTDRAHAAGKKIAELAKEKKITRVVFDRGGFLYAGRVKAAADGARDGGLKF